MLLTLTVRISMVDLALSTQDVRVERVGIRHGYGRWKHYRGINLDDPAIFRIGSEARITAKTGTQTEERPADTKENGEQDDEPRKTTGVQVCFHKPRVQ